MFRSERKQEMGLTILYDFASLRLFSRHRVDDAARAFLQLLTEKRNGEVLVFRLPDGAKYHKFQDQLSCTELGPSTGTSQRP